jgi:hypothetical protein
VAKWDHRDALAVAAIGIGVVGLFNRKKIVAVVQQKQHPLAYQSTPKQQKTFKTSRGW